MLNRYSQPTGDIKRGLMPNSAESDAAAPQSGMPPTQVFSPEVIATGYLVIALLYQLDGAHHDISDIIEY